MSKPHQTQTLAAFGQNLRWGAQAGVAKGCPMLMSELYETEVGYHTWVTKLVAWQNDLGKPKTISICQCDTVGTLATCALWNIQVF